MSNICNCREHGPNAVYCLWCNKATPNASKIAEEHIKRRNRVIEKANEMLQQLWDAGLKAQGREMGQGVEIAIERPGWGGPTVSYQIIPWEDTHV